MTSGGKETGLETTGDPWGTESQDFLLGELGKFPGSKFLRVFELDLEGSTGKGSSPGGMSILGRGNSVS